MEYPVPAYTSFTIPTGATSGARITFNEFGDGAIRVYDSFGHLVEIISPTANGGSTIIYSTVHTGSLGLTEGTIFFGAPDDFTDGSTITGRYIAGGGLVFDTNIGQFGGFTDGTKMTGTAGQDGAATGSGVNPRWIINDDNGTTPVDILLSGSIIPTNVTGTAATWQTPTFTAGMWADTAGVGTWPPLKWRLDAENNVHVHGSFHALVTNPSNGVIATGLPVVNLYPGGTGFVGVGMAAYISNSFCLALYLDNTGSLHAATTGGINAGAGFAVNCKIPIGTIL